MNKKILTKTLLPIASIALIGGGIASSLALTSCSNGTKLTSRNYAKYLDNHAVKCEDATFYINGSNEITDTTNFFTWLSNNYTKQVFINGIISASFAGGSGVAVESIEIKSDSIIGKLGENQYKFIFEKWNDFSDHVVNAYTNDTPHDSYVVYPGESFQKIAFTKFPQSWLPNVINLYPNSTNDGSPNYFVAQTDLTGLHIETQSQNG